MAMHIAKDDMKCDCLCIYLVQDHEDKTLEELKFLYDASAMNWYMMNYSFGDRIVVPEDIAANFI